MGIIVDLILIGILLVFILAGYKKGLTGSLLKLISFALSIVIAFVLYKPVSNIIINNTQINENIKSAIINNFSENKNENSEEQNKIQNSILNNVNKEIENATTEAKNTIVEQSAERISTTIINLGCAIIVFLIAKVILWVISFFIKGVASFPIIKQIDKLGGIAYGVVEGLIIIYAVLAIISFASLVWTDSTIIQAINKSVLGNNLYNNNILINLFVK